MTTMRFVLAMALVGFLSAPAAADVWQMKQRDMWNTGRAYFSPAENDAIFDAVLWQKKSPSGPGNFTSTSMTFYDGAYDGLDIVIGGYHWPKGVQAMNRQTGALFWFGNPGGGETIGAITSAFSNDGRIIYAVNDASAGPCKAWYTTSNPVSAWTNAGDVVPGRLSSNSPTIAPDGRIFLHAWNDRPYGGTDSPGVGITQTWAAATGNSTCYSDPALYVDGENLMVITSGRAASIKAYDGASGAQLWATATPAGTDGNVTIDPVTGNIYIYCGWNDIWAVGLDKYGNKLWPDLMVWDWLDGTNNPQRSSSAGCLSHDGLTYYFQTNSIQGDGRLYAVNTATGALKWAYNTGSTGWEMPSSCPIVTPNGVVIVGNNNGDIYYAIKDNGSSASVLDTFVVDSGGNAQASATWASDGKLYLPLRTSWTASNGDGEVPDGTVQNLYTCFGVTPIPEPATLALLVFGSLLGLARLLRRKP